MTDVFDQDEAETMTIASSDVATVNKVFGGGVEIAEATKLRLPEALGDYIPATATEAKFLDTLVELPWLAQGDAAVEMALSIALGDPEKAGQEMEGRSVKNLKLVNKRHSIAEFALSIASKFDDSSARGCPVYAQVIAALPDGDKLEYSIGGWGPIGQLVAWHRGGLFPRMVMIIAVPTGKGNPAYRYIDA
ncbi:MAG: hypothetical protein ACYCV4_02580 [Dermatophilaceae bacterium]